MITAKKLIENRVTLKEDLPKDLQTDLIQVIQDLSSVLNKTKSIELRLQSVGDKYCVAAYKSTISARDHLIECIRKYKDAYSNAFKR